jgi:hypothetical protein
LLQALHLYISKTNDDAAIAIFKNLEVQISTAQSSADINDILKCVWTPPLILNNDYS